MSLSSIIMFIQRNTNHNKNIIIIINSREVYIFFYFTTQQPIIIITKSLYKEEEVKVALKEATLFEGQFPPLLLPPFSSVTPFLLHE